MILTGLHIKSNLMTAFLSTLTAILTERTVVVGAVSYRRLPRGKT